MKYLQIEDPNCYYIEENIFKILDPNYIEGPAIDVDATGVLNHPGSFTITHIPETHPNIAILLLLQPANWVEIDDDERKKTMLRYKFECLYWDEQGLLENSHIKSKIPEYRSIFGNVNDLDEFNNRNDLGQYLCRQI